MELSYKSVTQITFSENDSKMSTKMITKSEKRCHCEHLQTCYENTTGKVAATFENNLQKASHKSSKFVEKSHLDTTRVPDTHFYVCGGPEEATPLQKSTKIDDALRKSTDIDGNLWKYGFAFLRRMCFLAEGFPFFPPRFF